MNLIPKKSRKQDSIWLDGLNGSKIVFAILTKVIVFYISLTKIDVKAFNFKFIPRQSVF